MLLCADADAACAELASGVLACPSCGTGRLRSWGLRAGAGDPGARRAGTAGCGPDGDGAARAVRRISCCRRGPFPGGQTPSG